MQTFETARDIIKLARAFHEQVADLYGRMGQQAQKRRVEMLLEHMSRHERHLATCMAQFGADISDRALDTWFQFVPDDMPADTLAHVSFEPDMSVDDVVRLARELDDCLARIYRQAREESDSRELYEIFTNLIEMEEQEKTRLSRESLGVKQM